MASTTITAPEGARWRLARRTGLLVLAAGLATLAASGPSRARAAGDPASGDPAPGDPASGDPAPGDPASGNPASGNPASGDPASGNPASGDPAPGDPASGNPASGDPASGNPASGNPASGDPASGDRAPGSPASGAPAAAVGAAAVGGGARAPLASAPLIAPSGLSGAAMRPPLGLGNGADVAGAEAVRLGELQSAVGGGARARGSAPNWTVTPSLGLTEAFTDNAAGAAGASGGSGADLASLLQPGIAVQGDTPRLQVNLAYDPQIYLYARDGSQDRVGHDFNGRALATLQPDTLFIDLRGSGAEVSQFGGLGPAGTTLLSNNDAAQQYSFSAAPYLVHRFATFGTGELGYTVARTVDGGYAQASRLAGSAAPEVAFNPPGLPPGLPLVAMRQSVSTQNVHAAFATGEAFGRVNGTLLASATRFDGTGVLADAHRVIDSLDSLYALSRHIILLGTFGYEDIRYAGTNPIRVRDVLWDGGIRLIPGADSSISLRYGHHDGFDALSLDAALAVTPRVRFAARYAAGLSTGAEQLQNALATTDLDSLGNPVDHTTGVPVFAAGNFFALQNDLYRLQQASLTASYVLSRDIFSAELDSERRRAVSGSPGAASLGSDSGTYGSLSWARDLTPRLRGAAFVQYGVRGFQGPPASTERSAAVSASLSYLLGPGLIAAAQYGLDRTVSRTRNGTGTGTGTGAAFGAIQGTTASVQNLVLVSLAQTF